MVKPEGGGVAHQKRFHKSAQNHFSTTADVCAIEQDVNLKQTSIVTLQGKE